MFKSVIFVAGLAVAAAYLAPGLTSRLLGVKQPSATVAIPPQPAAVQTPRTDPGDVTRLSADRTGHYLTEVQINGRTFNALVDTGATLVALRYEDARALGLVHPGDRFETGVRTAGGMAQARQVQLRSIRLGSIRVDDVEALVMDEGLLPTNLLGMSFLKKLKRFEVDRGTLVLER
jgi:aspartyl protease family protein